MKRKFLISAILCMVMSFALAFAACGPKDIAVTGVTLDQTSATLEVGDTLQLNATVEPADALDKTVFWDSVDDRVATVSATGLVTANKAGSTVIIVTTVDGDFTAECVITVNETQPSTYTVTFDANGGTSVDSQTVEEGAKATEPTAPTKEATAEFTYEFAGWLLNGSAYDFDTAVTGNITLVADWTATKNSYTATFVVDGQTASTETKEYGLKFGEPVAPTKEATAEFTYEFAGWLLNGVAYDFDTAVTGDITLIADWTATKNTYTVTYNSNGGTPVDSETKEYGLTFAQPVAPTKSATDEYTYEFAGWLLDGEPYSFATPVTGDITLVAKWNEFPVEATVYTVTFDANGGVLTGEATTSVEENTAVTEPADPTKQATAEFTYEFAGWLLNGEAYNFDTLVTGNITLVADWTATKNTYTVTFDSNGGTAVASQTVEYGLVFTEPTAPTKDATAEYTYEFAGWLLNGSAYDFDTVVTGNITLIANWTETPVEPEEPEDVAVTGITLNKSTVELINGTTYKLEATVEPNDATNKTVVWSSNNETVATVDANGNVSALIAGTATITATTVDGAFTATCVVTVPTLALNYTEINLTNDASDFKQCQLEIKQDVSGADSITWTSLDTSIATVSDTGLVTGIKTGETKIKVDVQYGDSVISILCTVHVKFNNIDLPEMEL